MLIVVAAGRATFNKAAIMRHAHRQGRYALRMCRTLSERRECFARWLRKAWAAAKAEAHDLAREIEREAGHRIWLAQRAREAAALAAHFANDAEAIRWEIERESYRPQFNPARIDTLRAALSTLGA